MAKTRPAKARRRSNRMRVLRVAKDNKVAKEDVVGDIAAAAVIVTDGNQLLSSRECSTATCRTTALQRSRKPP